MLISPQNKFIFVHVPKTAGAAAQRMLTPYAIEQERTLMRSLKRRLPFREDPSKVHFRTHEPAVYIRKKLGPEAYAGFHSFAVVRNPFDQAVSHFEYMKQYRSERIAASFEHISFRDYLKMRLTPFRPWHRIFVHLPDQAYFVVDGRDNIIVDRILRFENLNRDLDALFAHLGLDPGPLPEFNVTKSRKRGGDRLSSYYGAEEIALVQELYERDFRVFGYSDEFVTG